MVNEVITLAEVARKYNVDKGNLHKKLLRKLELGILVKGVDARLAGNVWIINKKAVRKLLK